ncbi:MAG: acetate--CoA ligase family protein [Pseudomonadota bacterium]
MSAPDQRLDSAVFRPSTVALVGVSSNPASPAGRPLNFLHRSGFKGIVHAVNPVREVVQGVRSHPSVQECDPTPEHAYILLGQPRVEDAVRACGDAGVTVATILADGYAESGAEGRRKQDRLVEIARSSGMRLLGPNSMGVADLHAGALITTNAIYQDPALKPGHVGLISQSGSMMGGLISRAAAIGVGFSRVAAVGNECDIGLADIGTMMLTDPNTRVITLFLETIRDAEGLARFAGDAHRVGKPVIAYKLGRSRTGQQLAVAHTGALLADDAVIECFLRDVGIARVSTLEGLVEAPMLFSARRPNAESQMRVGVLTTTGGGAATVTDRLALEGVTIIPPSDATYRSLSATGLSVAEGTILDLTLAGAEPQYVRAATEAVARDPRVDLVLSVTGSSGRASPETSVAPLIGADTKHKPLACFFAPDAPDALKQLTSGDVPAFRTPESCADVIAAFLRWRSPRCKGPARKPVTAEPVALDELRSLDLLDTLGVTTVARSVAVPGAIEDPPFDYPIVVKALTDAIPHKSDVGGVIVGVETLQGARQAMERIRNSIGVALPGIEITRFLLSPMIPCIQEVLVGYRLDPIVGPVVTVAPGGILVGLYDDKSIRLAPVDAETALGMIGEVTGLAPLRGHRGRPPGDLSALADLIVSMSRLAAAEETILEAEANPVMVSKRSAVAVDALVTVPAVP